MEDRLKFAVIYAALVFVIAVPFTFVVKESDVSWGLSLGTSGITFLYWYFTYKKEAKAVGATRYNKKTKGHAGSKMIYANIMYSFVFAYLIVTNSYSDGNWLMLLLLTSLLFLGVQLFQHNKEKLVKE